MHLAAFQHKVFLSASSVAIAAVFESVLFFVPILENERAVTEEAEKAVVLLACDKVVDKPRFYGVKLGNQSPAVFWLDQLLYNVLLVQFLEFLFEDY